MFYQGPDRYQGYEIRPPPPRNAPEYYPYVHRPSFAQNPSPNRDFVGFMQPELAPRYRMSDPSDQGDELLHRLEQTGRVPSKDKFRRMACNTFIMTGACPYSDRCVFMHDFRIKCEGARVRTTRQTKADNTIKDTFYWPDMTRKDITRYLDAQGLPDANQRYVIPESFASLLASFHNRGLYSVWNHFVEFCVHNNRLEAEHKPMERDNFFQVSDYAGNRHIFGTYRLAVFVHLSVVREERSARKHRQVDSSFASGFTTRDDSATGDSAYALTSLNTSLNTSMNTPTKLSASTINANYSTASLTPSTTPRSLTYTTKNKLTIDTALEIDPPLPRKLASEFTSLVIQAPDDDENPAPRTLQRQDQDHSYSKNTTMSNTPRNKSYNYPTTSYVVTPPTDSTVPVNATHLPYGNNNTHTAFLPRHPPSFASLRATSAASIGQYAPARLSMNTSYDSPIGADYSSQRRYRTPTPRNTTTKTTNSTSERTEFSNVQSNTNCNSNAALYADLLDETVGEGYTTSQPKQTNVVRVPSVTNKSAMHTVATPAIYNSTTISSAIANNRSTRTVKTVNWADLNNSSSSSSISDSDNLSDDIQIDINRVQSEEWEQVGDYHSTSSISNSSTDSTASVPIHPTSVLDILQQAVTMTNVYSYATTSADNFDYNNYTTTNNNTTTNNTSNDSELSPWADPTYLDLHLLGDSNDANDHGMRDTGGMRALLGMNLHSTSGVEDSYNMDYLLGDIGLSLSPIQLQHSP